MAVIKEDFWDVNEFVDYLDELDDIDGKTGLEGRGQLVLCQKDQRLELY